MSKVCMNIDKICMKIGKIGNINDKFKKSTKKEGFTNCAI